MRSLFGSRFQQALGATVLGVVVVGTSLGRDDAVKHGMGLLPGLVVIELQTNDQHVRRQLQRLVTQVLRRLRIVGKHLQELRQQADSGHIN